MMMTSSDESNEIMLFGVRVKVDPMRKSASMNDLSHYVHLQTPPLTNTVDDNGGGYVSADDVIVPDHHRSNGSAGGGGGGARERKRGVPWTEDEHKLFLLGLQKVGKGDWRGISRNFVKTRTPTQVASHAQKYFLRRSNLNRRRRRSSLFDMTTDSVGAIPMEEQVNEDTTNKAASPQISPLSGFPMATFPATVSPVPSQVLVENQMETVTFSNYDQINNAAPALPVYPIALLPTPDTSTMADLNMIQKHEMDSLSLSLNLSLSYDHNNRMNTPAYQAMPSFNSGDGLISVG
ncbi:Homeodomain-like protein [Artemisia annua]|uniref:Homeodomain-like protein n=1 Tax=Artemisia annua TaxID=35608 RepID=A0A2U1P1H1_ARTAN|nr:Homeodomain-like protein [Artemisia annua]